MSVGIGNNSYLPFFIFVLSKQNDSLIARNKIIENKNFI